MQLLGLDYGMSSLKATYMIFCRDFNQKIQWPPVVVPEISPKAYIRNPSTTHEDVLG